MEIEKIYNNSGNYEVYKHVAYVKFSVENMTILNGDASTLYKDKKLTEKITTNEIKDLISRDVLIKAVGDTNGEIMYVFTPCYVSEYRNTVTFGLMFYTTESGKMVPDAIPVGIRDIH